MPRPPPQTQTKPSFEVQGCLVNFKQCCVSTNPAFSEDSKQKHKYMASRSMFTLFLAQRKTGNTGNLTKSALPHRLFSYQVLLL